MTREEAINRIKDHMKVHHIGEYPHIRLKEALDMALSSLHPVSRERMQGEWIAVGAITCKCSRCQHSELSTRANEYLFCPRCGAPMTDEAVDMVMERLEALYD